MNRLRTSACAAILALSTAAFAQSDYQWTFGDDGMFNYILTSVSDPIVYDDTIPANDPTLNLLVGKRYAVTINDPFTHPFEVLAKGADFSSDIVLLSQAVAGSLESDVDINWVESGNTVEFTVTMTLVNEMRQGGRTPGYRCAAHVADMRGDFDVFGAGTPIADPILDPIVKGDIIIELQTIATGFPSPIGMAVPDDSTGRIFIYDQNGEISILQGGSVLPTPFLDVSSRLVSPLGTINGININFDERGLLGLALHPNFNTNGKIYTYTSEPEAGTPDFTTMPPAEDPDHHGVIAEWTVSTTDANQIDPLTRREILRFDQPQFNHNGGELAFGPDGFLYIALGDGGGRDDEDGNITVGQETFGHGPDGNGQDKDTFLGTILRIDVDGTSSANGQYAVPASNPFVGTDGLDEIWAWGLRNPFRFSFDDDGTMYLSDVGQGFIEEINIGLPGMNYGWRLKEGSFFFDPMGPGVAGVVVTEPVAPIPPDVIDPIAEFDHDEGISVIGGYVYRGTVIPELVGKYVFGDFQGNDAGLGRLFYLDTGNEIKELQIGTDDRELGLYIKGFGRDLDGEVYIFVTDSRGPTGNGEVLKIVAAPSGLPIWSQFD